MDLNQIKQLLKTHNQEHLLQFYDTLSANEQQDLVAQIQSLDLQRMNDIFTISTRGTQSTGSLDPIVVDTADEKYKQVGLDAIRNHKVGLVLLAGGQGTRLGSSDPKGMYDIRLPSSKSLFQLQAERVHRLQVLAGGSTIPWYIMTSGPTRKRTEEFFKQNKYFGLQESQILFFDQGVLPAFTKEGKIMLETKSSIAFSPDGNGGIYQALSKVIGDMEKRGVEYIHCYCVDNCLVKVCDPKFVGFCIDHKVDCGAKSILKVDPHEKVGVICLKDGKPCVVEYSEIDKEKAELKKGDELVYKAANIANHFYTVDFLKKVMGMEMEYHIAHKKIKTVDTNGNVVDPKEPNGIKLEMFIFDVFPFAKNFKVVQVERNQEFSPLKNKDGADSPETSKRDILALHKTWLEKAGATVTGDVEISPLVSYDGEGLESFKGQVLTGPLVLDQ